MEKYFTFISRGAVLGLLAGAVFLVLQIANAALVSGGAAALEPIYLLTSIYSGAGRTAAPNSLQLVVALLMHALLSLAVGVATAWLLQRLTEFSSWKKTVVAAMAVGIGFWLLLIYVVEPQLFGTSLLLNQTNIWRQLLIQAITFTVFAGFAQPVFRPD